MPWLRRALHYLQTLLPKKALTCRVYSCFNKPVRFCTSESNKKQLQIRYQKQTNKGNTKLSSWVSGPHLTLPITEETQAPLLHKWARCVEVLQTNLCSSGMGSSRRSETSWPHIEWDDALQEFASAPLSNELAFAWRSRAMLCYL